MSLDRRATPVAATVQALAQSFLHECFEAEPALGGIAFGLGQQSIVDIEDRTHARKRMSQCINVQVGPMRRRAERALRGVKVEGGQSAVSDFSDRPAGRLLIRWDRAMFGLPCRVARDQS